MKITFVALLAASVSCEWVDSSLFSLWSSLLAHPLVALSLFTWYSHLSFAAAHLFSAPYSAAAYLRALASRKAVAQVQTPPIDPPIRCIGGCDPSTPQTRGSPTVGQIPQPIPQVPCGTGTCPPGQVCCNEDCGICATPDTDCETVQSCDEDEDV